jgi:hypothetical protein
MPVPRQDLRMRTFELVTALALARCVVLVGDASESVARFNPLNATYNVGDDKVKLVDGKAISKPAQPGSAIRTITKIVVRPASGDLNRDGKTDAAVVLMQDPGGSGTFYYIAAAVNVNGQAQGTNAILLGARIALRTVRIVSGQIIVTYADRKPSEPFAAKPTVPVTKRFVLQGQVLKEAALSPTLAAARLSDRTMHCNRHSVSLIAEGVLFRVVAGDRPILVNAMTLSDG